MTQAAEFITKVIKGKLPDSVLHGLMEAAAKLDGKAVVVSIKERKRIRSNNQNRYLWGVVIRRITEAFREAGNVVDDDDVYAYLKAEVWKLKRVMVTGDGEVLRGPGSTRDKDTMQMEVLLEQARVWAAQTLGISIPLPHETLTTEEN